MWLVCYYVTLCVLFFYRTKCQKLKDELKNIQLFLVTRNLYHKNKKKVLTYLQKVHTKTGSKLHICACKKNRGKPENE